MADTSAWSPQRMTQSSSELFGTCADTPRMSFRVTVLPLCQGIIGGSGIRNDDFSLLASHFYTITTWVLDFVSGLPSLVRCVQSIRTRSPHVSAWSLIAMPWKEGPALR